MTESPKESLKESPKQRQKQRRERRLSAALRDNLKRRKAQGRGRQAVPADSTEATGAAGQAHDSAGFADDKRNR